MAPTLASVVLNTKTFEAILLQLPLRDLLHAQRVCCYWRDTIMQSCALQQKLFFQPVSRAGQQARYNQLLQELFPHFFIFAPVPEPEYRRATSAQDIYKLDWCKDGNRRGRVLRQEASWRRMFPVQPPARIERTIHTSGCGCERYYVEKGVIADEFQYLQENGASMGLIWDICVDGLIGPHACLFVQWHTFPALPEYENVENELFIDVEDSHGILQVAGPGDKITIHIQHIHPCMGDKIRDSGLEIIECHPEMISTVWSNDKEVEDRDLFDAASWPELSDM